MTKAEKISHALSALSIIVSVVIAYLATVSDQSDKKIDFARQQKTLEYTTRTIFSPPEDGSEVKDGVTIEVKYNSKALVNGYVVGSTIRNTGFAPIKPDETYEPISIIPNPDWKIIDIKNTGKIRPTWKALEDGRFVSTPVLINSGESINIRVIADYVGKGGNAAANTYRSIEISNSDAQDSDSSPQYLVRPSPDPFQITARIANLYEVKLVDSFVKKPVDKALYDPFGIVVSIYSWGIPFFMVTFVVYLSFYIINQAGVLVVLGSDRYYAIYAIISALISMWAADAGTSLFLKAIGGNNSAPAYLNYPPVLINILCMIALYAINKKINAKLAAHSNASQSGVTS